MKKQQAEYKVNLIGDRDLSKLTKEELELLVAAFVKKNKIAKIQSLIFSRLNKGEWKNSSREISKPSQMAYGYGKRSIGARN